MRRVKSPVDRWRLLVSGPGGRHKRARPLNNRATLDERLKVLSHRPSLFQPGDWCPTVRQAARRIRKILHPVQTCPAQRHVRLKRPPPLPRSICYQANFHSYSYLISSLISLCLNSKYFFIAVVTKRSSSSFLASFSIPRFFFAIMLPV